MMEPVITIDAPISFVVGATLAVRGRDRVGPSAQGRDRLLRKGLLFQSTVLSPIILFFMLRFPDWEWNYFFDARAFFLDDTDTPWGFAALTGVMVLVNLSFYGGFVAAESLVLRGRAGAAVRLIAVVSLVVLVTMAVLYEQTLHVGSLAEYQAGTAPLLFVHKEFLAVLILAGVALATSLAWLLASEGLLRRQQ